MNYFYFHRMGPDNILAEHLIDERYARIALHPEDTAVPAYPGWCSGCDDFDLLGKLMAAIQNMHLRVSYYCIAFWQAHPGPMLETLEFTQSTTLFLRGPCSTFMSFFLRHLLMAL